MNKFKVEQLKSEKLHLFIKAALMAMLPVLCCVIYCAMQGRSLSEVYLPASEWNDELFYFKQVEGVLEYGYPLGYYGFNESRALSLSFAAWSPVLLFPWILWGSLFGWTVISPIYCNIFMMALAMVLFVVLVRPSWKQVGIVTLLFSVFTPFTRYMMCGMPEIICCSMAVIFYSIAIHALRSKKMWEIFLLFLWSGIMTLMRPYLLLFMLLPVFMLVKRKKWLGLFISGGITAVVLAGYWAIKHYFGAAYFAPLFFTDWLTAFFDQGFFAGIKHFFGKLYWNGRDVFAYVTEGFKTGLPHGAYYGGYLAVTAILIGYGIKGGLKLLPAKKEKEKNKTAEEAVTLSVLHLALTCVAMFFAILLMYKVTEGSRHLLTFMAAGIFLVSLMETKFYKKAMFVGALCFYLYSYKGTDPYYYQVPFIDEKIETQLRKVSEVLEKEMVLEKEQVPSFENVMIWALSDKCGEEDVYTKWQVLYGLPKGFGINCCKYDYLDWMMGDLSCRYLTTVAGGRTAARCEERGFTLLYEDEEVSVYRR